MKKITITLMLLLLVPAALAFKGAITEMETDKSVYRSIYYDDCRDKFSSKADLDNYFVLHLGNVDDYLFMNDNLMETWEDYAVKLKARHYDYEENWKGLCVSITPKSVPDTVRNPVPKEIVDAAIQDRETRPTEVVAEAKLNGQAYDDCRDDLKECQLIKQVEIEEECDEIIDLNEEYLKDELCGDVVVEMQTKIQTTERDLIRCQDGLDCEEYTGVRINHIPFVILMVAVVWFGGIIGFILGGKPKEPNKNGQKENNKENQ